MWLMNGTTRRQVVDLQPNNAGGPAWEVAGAGDFNGDGRPDLLWQHGLTSELMVWFMNGTTRLAVDTPYPNRPASDAASWKVQAVGDYDSDGQTDILWQHQTEGYLVAWLMDGIRQRTATPPTPNRPASDFANWKVITTEKADRTGRTHWFWQHQGGGWLVAWLMGGLIRDSVPAVVPNVPEGDAASWKLVASADMDGDGKLDLIFRNRAAGANLVWRMNGATRLGTMPLDFY